MALTDKRRRVIDAYMKCFNKKQAMLDADYSISMATTAANTVFNDPAVKAEIERRMNLGAHRADITLDWIVDKLKAILEADIGDMLDIYSDGTAKYNFNKMTPALRIALSKFQAHEYTEGRGKNAVVVKAPRVEFADKVRAAELLIRHLGLSKEKAAIELSGEVGLVEQLHKGRSRAGLVGGTLIDSKEEE